MAVLDEISKAIIEGEDVKILTLTKAALDASVPAKEILDNALVLGIQKVGDLFERGEYFLPELVMAGNAMTRALELLEPILAKGDTPYVGKFLIGTVKDDVHDIGKNIFVMMLKGNGWKVTDLGVDIPPEEFCSMIEKGDFNVLGLSSLLTMTMARSAETIDALKAGGLRDKVKIMVGGAPVTQQWADKVGADGYAADAPAAVKVAASLVGKS
ncbi:MAG: corrinoid protein [Deltaproteobacteria bacterium]|jgi:5-methyltetrahydrofolate--homocysteine methyltransferase|nr:MAG: corrinoid protein [Deltaproteobacteria bacterium]